MTHRITIVAHAALLFAGAVLVGAPAPSRAAAAVAETPEAMSAAQGDELSDAEILIRAQSLIEQDEARLSASRERRGELGRSLESATKQFAVVDAQRKAADAARAEEQGAGLGEAKPSAADRHALEASWTRARTQLDLVIRRRQTLDQAIQILEAKLSKLQETIDFITLGQLATEDSDGTPATSPAPNDRSEVAEPAELDEAPLVAATATSRDLYERRVAEALVALREVETELRVANHRARLVKEVISLNQKDLTLVEAAANVSLRQESLLTEEAARLEASLATELQRVEGAVSENDVVTRQLDQTRQLAAETAAIAADYAALAVSLESRLTSLQPLRDSILHDLDETQDRFDAARRRFEFHQSPIAPHRLLRWLIHRGPLVLASLVMLFVLWRLARRLARRVVSGTVSLSAYGSPEERLERIETLSRVFQGALTVGIVLIGVLVLLPQFGIDVAVLLGGAAVFSLAVAFGAQNLVQDYFSGFMILVENQYRVGNVIEINQAISGVVEDVTLRMTTLRDLEGVAHFVPHSRIQTVSNMTHGWSRVALDVPVAYRENVDHVMSVLLEVALEMRNSPEYCGLIVDDPEMLGVDAFESSAVVVKLLVRTRPLKQWLIKRELLRRIKNRFDELGIEIPLPHRTVYHRTEEPRAVRPSDARDRGV